MNRFFQIIIFVFLFTQLSAQKFQIWETTEDDVISCPASHHKTHAAHNPIPFVIDKNLTTAEFIPQYIGVPDTVRSTMVFVFDILNQFISSEVPINVSVELTDLGSGDGGGVTLADARAGAFAANFPGAEFINTTYPIALAEKLAARELNEPGEPDIFVRINSNTRANFSISPNDPNIGNRSDLATVLLHEVVHGLGFFAAAIINDDGLGLIGRDPYTTFMFNSLGESLIDDFQNGSVELARQYTNQRLRFRSPSFDEIGAILHAPTTFSPGSSISHIDLGVYRNTPDRLMAPVIMSGDINYDPGLAADMLADMGWVTSNVIHEQDVFTTEDTSLPLSARYRTDSEVLPNEIILHYSRDTFATEDIVVTVPFGTLADEYFFSIDNSDEGSLYQYFFEVVGSDGTIGTTPKIAPESFYQVVVGPDREAPVLSGHVPITTIRESDTQFTLEINEFFDFFTGIDTTTLAAVVSLNGQIDTTAFVQMEDGFGVFFQAEITGNYTTSDELLYKIVALDNSINRNEGQLPLDADFYTIDIQASTGAVDRYLNDFNIESNDFTGTGFDIIQVDGFESPAIHGDHPYLEAGTGNSLSFTYELSQLIRVSATNPTIVFDEIVLVEPGEGGTSCRGADCDLEFWDYVVVEAQRPGDESWTALLDAYDSNSVTTWLFAFAGQEQGDPSLFRSRTIDITETGDFVAGDEIFIRFRLFSDPFLNGWGWAIDNLEIQTSSSVLEEELLEEFTIYPNPALANQIVSISVNITEPIQGQLNFLSSDGRLIWQDRIDGVSSFQRNYNTTSLPAGTYIVQIASTEGNSSRQVIIAR